MSFAIHASHPNTETSPQPVISVSDSETGASLKEINTNSNDTTKNTSVQVQSLSSHTLIMHDTGEVSDFH